LNKKHFIFKSRSICGTGAFVPDTGIAIEPDLFVSVDDIAVKRRLPEEVIKSVVDELPIQTKETLEGEALFRIELFRSRNEKPWIRIEQRIQGFLFMLDFSSNQ
jgi:hypothetical protein